MSRVITFGEIMMRLSPPDYQRFVQAKEFEVAYGGGEANVAFSLAQLGIDTSFVTKLPKNPLGDSVVNELKRYGVDTSFIARGGERLGIYFCEKGAAMRPSKVVYDRKYSAISQAVIGDFDWLEIFKDAQWFHFTGISPALGENVAELCLEACQMAKKSGLTISCDLNYRKNLWTKEKAKEVMSELMPYVDLIIANEEDAEKVFGIKAESTDITTGLLNVEAYKEVAKKLKQSFGFKKVAITLRESFSASDNGWSGLLYDDSNYYKAKRYQVHIVDRVGGGDSFAAGLIYSFLNDYPAQRAIEFAVAASALKHTIEGDFNIVSVEEVEKLAEGDASGRVQR